MLKEEWIENPNTETDILSYILQVRDRLETSREIMEENVKLLRRNRRNIMIRRQVRLSWTQGIKCYCCYPVAPRNF